LGDTALADSLRKLALVYDRAFRKKPSIYRSSARGAPDLPNSWVRFLRAVLTRILGPGKCPSISILESRWDGLSKI
jgi:hypothetical protein